ncbi:haloacid dehalogenase-like hydrolase [Actinacidiphila glaucinigra]|uniref:HAD family hydrolase n=1 Tax=Actinacidiphila glaucinigra TaxID=235986 RepID=UPI0033A86B5A
MGKRRLVLWDIDHTLISTGGVGRELSAIAFEQATGQPMEQQAAIDGITERVIFRETARLHGLTTSPEDFARFAAALTEAHLSHLTELRMYGHALPGSAAALDAFAGLRGVVQTVVSGNVRAVAEIKLQTFGLDRHIVWEAGAYGDDYDERPELVRAALARAGEYLGEPVSADEALLIGDTPADVHAALMTGVQVLAVASGRSTEEDLRNAGATNVLRDLTDTSTLTTSLSPGLRR